jgi:MoxR-like ATPase
MILADEINRTPPKTQAALLEAMQETRVTVGERTYQLKTPFFVLATQNPLEQEGTYPLPEAQQDRFMLHVKVRYPSRDEEREILLRTTTTYHEEIKPVIDGATILACQETVRKVPVPAHVYELVLDLVRFSRPDEPGAPESIRGKVAWGAGPRASQYLILGGKARALLHDRTHVTPEDIESLALPVMRHRVKPNFNAEAEGLTADDIIRDLLAIVQTKKRI